MLNYCDKPSQAQDLEKAARGCSRAPQVVSGVQGKLPLGSKSEGQVGERTGHSRSMGGGDVASRENSTRRDPVKEKTLASAGVRRRPKVEVGVG